VRVRLIAVGKGMPVWVEQGLQEYTRRLPTQCRLELHEVAAGRRGRNADTGRLKEEEGGRLLAAVPGGARRIALDERGRAWRTQDLARHLGQWLEEGTDVAMLVGGPDGLSPACLDQAHLSWSLSSLTLPHMLVRILVAEQLYRAWSILSHHPYHRT